MRIKITTVISFAISLGIACTNSVAIEQKISIGSRLSSLPLLFTENKGQWPDSILYRSSAGGVTMWFKQTGVYYQFNNSGTNTHSQTEAAEDDSHLAIKHSSAPKSVEITMIESEFVSAEITSVIEGFEPSEYKCNYFFGSEPNKWRTDVPSYESIIYRGVYPGIDLKFHGNGHDIKYDFIVSPGADYRKIRIRYNNAGSIAIGENGELIIKISKGEIIENPPVVFQYINGHKSNFECKYIQLDDKSFGFAVEGNYNPAHELIIDPVLVYSSYLGGLDFDGLWDIAVDEEGGAYITGITYSQDFPLHDPFQSIYLEGFGDAFITKMASDGSHLIYSTFFGGNGRESGEGIALDSLGAVYLTGETGSADFPLMNAFQGVRGDFTDAFAVKLSSAGNELLFGTYLGGSGADFGYDIAVDYLGQAYVAGQTTSSDFPTRNPVQPIYKDGGRDAFVAKFVSSGSDLVYSTYLGGTSADIANAIAVDAFGHAYITGATDSPDYPTLNSYQFDQPSRDAFVTKLSESGANLVFSTYLGGSELDYGLSVIVDSNGVATISGMTTSLNFPTVNPYQNSNHGGLDILIAKLSADGSNLIYSTYLGGSFNDYGRSIKMDASGAMYVTGETYSNDFPILDEIQSNQPGIDGYLARLSNSGNQLLFSTYLGGSASDNIYSMALDNRGVVSLVGYTQSEDFVLQNPFQDTFMGGDFEGFISKISFCCLGNRGDVDGNGVDSEVADLTFLVDHIFRAGPLSACPEEADVNDDGSTSNILDLTFLVNRLFRGGPAPGPC